MSLYRDDFVNDRYPRREEIDGSVEFDRLWRTSLRPPDLRQILSIFLIENALVCKIIALRSLLHLK